MRESEERPETSEGFPAWVFLGATLETIVEVMGSSSNVDVFVMQADQEEAARIRKGLKLEFPQRLRIYESLGALNHAGVFHKAHQGLLYCDGIQSGVDLLMQLPSDYSVDKLVGWFNGQQTDPVTLHRLSRKVSKRFSWRDMNSNAPLTGHWHNGPEVSIIVPVFGVESYLEQCLSSLLQQSLEDFEVLVIDDGSKDRSGEIADQWAVIDSRIRVHHQSNAGCASARMTGLSRSEGYFVAFVDGDDWIDAEMLEKLVHTAIQFDSEIAQCGFIRSFGVAGIEAEAVERFDLVRVDSSGAGLVRDPLDLALRQPTIWRRIYQRRFLEAQGIEFDTSIPRFDDLAFQFKTLTLVQRLAVTPGAYYRYRQQRPGQDILISDERLYVHFAIFDSLRLFVADHPSARLKSVFFKLQLASHHWAYSLIDSSLRKQYALAARHDLLRHHGFWGAIKMSILALTLGVRRGLWFLRLLTMSGDSQSAWNRARFY